MSLRILFEEVLRFLIIVGFYLWIVVYWYMFIIGNFYVIV